MNRYYFEVNDAGEIIGADFIDENAEVPEGFFLPWSDDVLLNVPKYNFSTGVWEEAGTPVEELNETHDGPQESTEEDIIEKLRNDNKVLSLRVEGLKKQMEAGKQANEETTLEILELMIGLL